MASIELSKQSRHKKTTYFLLSVISTLLLLSCTKTESLTPAIKSHNVFLDSRYSRRKPWIYSFSVDTTLLLEPIVYFDSYIRGIYLHMGKISLQIRMYIKSSLSICKVVFDTDLLPKKAQQRDFVGCDSYSPDGK